MIHLRPTSTVYSSRLLQTKYKEIREDVYLDAGIDCDEVLDLFLSASNLALASTHAGTARVVASDVN